MGETMRAVVLNRARELVLAGRPLPRPGPAETDIPEAMRDEAIDIVIDCPGAEETPQQWAQPC